MRVQDLNPRRWSTGRGGRAAATALLAAAGIALVVWLVVVPATRVQAATFTVNVATDEDDDNPGDGVCHTAGGQCTLRAAIEEADATVAQDVIAIGVTGPIVLLAGLPPITDNGLVITGSGQQVSLTAPGSAFTISNADGVQINDLVIDGADIGTIGILANNFADDLVLDGLTVRRFAAGVYYAIGSGGDRSIIRNCTLTANRDNGVVLNGGKDDVVRDSVITNNGDAAADSGIEADWEVDLLIQGNTFSGNVNAQLLIGTMGPAHVTIIQNTITSGSDGIVIGAGVDPAAALDIGLSVDNRNVFRGTIAAPAEQHLRDLSAVNITAIYNDWDAYSPAAIEGVICHDGDPGCGPGVVDIDPFINTPSPLPTVTATPTATETPGGATATPTVTPTGTPGGVETLPLIAGCNPVAWTGADGTPIANIAGAVSPTDILVALWQFEGGVWLGYSPQFPEVSDLTQMNRLDVVFVCVSANGTFSRPVI
jgi:CSLREA domain-containing protein